MQLEPNGCHARVYEGKGLKELIAYCERRPRKYITSPVEVTISHKCRTDDEKKFAQLKGTLRFDAECDLRYKNEPIEEIEDETDWTFDDLKRLETDLDYVEDRVLAGEILMIIGVGTVLFFSGVMCCSYLHKNKCQCEPCSSHTCNCNCKALNCFTCCCRKCKTQAPLGNQAENLPLNQRDAVMQNMPANL